MQVLCQWVQGGVSLPKSNICKVLSVFQQMHAVLNDVPSAHVHRHAVKKAIWATEDYFKGGAGVPGSTLTWNPPPSGNRPDPQQLLYPNEPLPHHNCPYALILHRHETL